MDVDPIDMAMSSVSIADSRRNWFGSTPNRDDSAAIRMDERENARVRPAGCRPAVSGR